ncbi:MAG: hypothetical protein MUC29_07285 [Pyrinomonadaceae bacterium]|jgi:SOS-response transcriptional repressor LexA|nr:hypothetical protein [Pyrinomonadaceae bacterium]
MTYLAKVLDFPHKKVVPTQNLERLICMEIIGNKLSELGMINGDEIIVDTCEAVGNGNVIVINQGDVWLCGIARFIGNGQMQLDYIHSTETFDLSEVKIIGRVKYSQRSWK